jgi:hypothetical protein
MRDDRSLEKRLSSDVWDRVGFACIMLSMAWDSIETSDAR